MPMKTRFARTLATMATAAVLTVSTTAVAAPARSAASLSLAKAPTLRAATVTRGKSRLGADIATSTFINIGILAALTVVVLTVVADGEDSPDSN